MSIIDPKTEIILNIVLKKTIQRLPLTICLVLSIAILTYIFIFYEALTINLIIVFILTLFITLITSFAFEYDTKDEIMVLINIGTSPSDIFRLTILRIWSLSIIGFFIGTLIAIIFPISQIENVKIFYTFLLSNGLGLFSSLYSAMRAMQLSLLNRISFRPIFEKEVPILLYDNELLPLKEYIKDRLKERIDLIILNISSKENSIEIACRYLGDFGRETFHLLTSLGINPDYSLKNDETFPMIKAIIEIGKRKRPIVECWEGNRKSSISYSFQTLLQQLIIEYKVYSGKLRGFELI
ncbi:MAG: hypothetical protein QW272_02690 [Candidatus Methanomethylicaceae archaeon]